MSLTTLVIFFVYCEGYGKTDEPMKGYCLTLIIAFGFVAIGEINIVAPLITSFFMASYGLVNLACFATEYSESPGFRPSFKLYNKWLSLLGAVLCIAIMFMMDPITALVTLGVVALLYKYIQYHSPTVNWGTATDAMTYRDAYKVQAPTCTHTCAY